MKRDTPFETREIVLLDRRPAYGGESWSGYLLRLAEANLLDGIRGLAALCGMTVQQALSERPPDLLPRFGMVPPDCAPEHGQGPRQSRRRSNPATSGRSLRSRVCPCCFRDDQDRFVRAEWDWPINLVCRLHQVLLMDCCQVCGQRVDVLRPKVDACRCGAMYKDQRSVHAPAWIDGVAQLFPEAQLEDAARLFEPASLLGQQAARICHWLIAQPSHDPDGPIKRIVTRDAFLDIRTAGAMQHLLADWPRRLADSVASKVDATSWQGYMRLSRRLRTPVFKRFREVIDELKRRSPRHQNPGSAQSMRKLHARGKTSFGIKDLMAVTGHSHGTLLRCIDDGGIPGASYSIDQPSGQRRFEIPREVFRAIEKAYVATNDIASSAVLAGCSSAAMCGLVRSGCVEGKRLLTTRGGDFCDRIDPAEVAGLARTMFALASRGDGNSRERVYFSAWVPGRYSIGKAQQWRLLFAAIVDGKLKVYKATDSPIALNDLYVLQGALDKATQRSTLVT